MSPEAIKRGVLSPLNTCQGYMKEAFGQTVTFSEECEVVIACFAISSIKRTQHNIKGNCLQRIFKYTLTSHTTQYIKRAEGILTHIHPHMCMYKHGFLSTPKK